MDYQYFKRDISWLSFNYRVLLEADDDTLPVGERLNFISIYSSNLEEFYKVRVADHKAVATGKIPADGPESVQEAMELVEEINREVNRQLEERVRIFEQKLLPALRHAHVMFFQSRREVQAPEHQTFVRTYFREEVLPYLAPVPVGRDKVVSFLRNDRLYLSVRVKPKQEANTTYEYFVMKLPYSKAPRFVELPHRGNTYYIMYLEDIIKANLDVIFPGYEVESAYCIKISRDADIVIDEEATNAPQLIEQVRTKVKRRKTGVICRFVYDRSMPADYLSFLMDAYHIDKRELVPGDKHLNLEDLRRLPLPDALHQLPGKPQPMVLDKLEAIFPRVEQKDLLLCYPYHSFGHFLHFLHEAATDPTVSKIMLTQYRVADNSAVINTLISAARNGKKVTVFVELKARFDEEHNLSTAQLMEASGIRILYSLPGLKVHAKVALVLRRDPSTKHKLPGIAYISTGNFNEKTATLYADCALFTANRVLVNDLHTLFRTLKGKIEAPVFHRLLVARFNLIAELSRLLREEMALARQGKAAKVILKMNALQDPAMIDLLYEASQAGVQIDLIVRGICCLVPGKEFSRNIRVTRLVDTFLEHARVWYFGGGGKPKVFLGSPDWMKRNLYRRIEAVVPVLHPGLKQELTDMLHLQLADRRKAVWLDSEGHNVWKSPCPAREKARAQYDFYEYLRRKNTVL